MTDAASPHILIVDDDVDHVEMLGEYLTAEGFEVDHCFNGADGLRLALGSGIDALVLDVMLPRLSGIEVLRELRRQSDIPVLMLTAKGDDIDRIIGLELGADDYLGKPFIPRELVARLRAILRRRQPSSTHSRVVTNGRITINLDTHEADYDGQLIELTVSEFNVLALMLKQVGKVVSKDELSLEVLNRPRLDYDRSIDVHISNLRQKLNQVGANASEIETIRGVGYKIAATS